MRATQASRSRSNAATARSAAMAEKPNTRQANLNEWKQFTGTNNMRRFTNIGLISRKKTLMAGAKAKAVASDKENGKTGDLQSRVATRRNDKVQQKAERKAFKHISSGISNIVEEKNVTMQLGLRTSKTTPANIQKRQQPAVVGRKRNFNQL